jgi:hypothetical protein
VPNDSLFDRLRELQQELDAHIDERRRQFHYRIERRKVEFERQIRDEHRKLRVSAFNYMVRSGFLSLLFSPLVYALIVPLVLLDLSVSLFQAVCFPVYGIQKVKRADYLAIDRQHLAYLNAIEKLNCVYCSYANGLLAYTRAIAGRAEEHWCPIKHARRLKGTQDEYWNFADYGDAEAFRRKYEDVYRQHLDRIAGQWIEAEDEERAKDGGGERADDENA